MPPPTAAGSFAAENRKHGSTTSSARGCGAPAVYSYLRENRIRVAD